MLGPMTESLSDSQRHVLLAIAQHPGGTDWNGLIAFLKSRKQLPADLHGDLAALFKGSLLATRGTYTPAQRKAEVDKAIAELKLAAANGTTFTWRTAETFTYGLTKTGVDVCKLLMPVKR